MVSLENQALLPRGSCAWRGHQQQAAHSSWWRHPYSQLQSRRTCTCENSHTLLDLLTCVPWREHGDTACACPIPPDCMQVYVWGRRHPYVQLSFLGIFTFTAPYLPWVLLAFSVVLRSSPAIDLLGMVAGKPTCLSLLF